IGVLVSRRQRQVHVSRPAGAHWTSGRGLTFDTMRWRPTERRRGMPPAIRPTAVYTTDDLTDMLQVSAAYLRDARLSGQLRSVYIGHKICYLGKWVLSWLEVESTIEDDAEESKKGNRRNPDTSGPA